MPNATAATSTRTMSKVAVDHAPAGVEVYQISTPGLGDQSYVVTDGTAAAILPEELR